MLEDEQIRQLALDPAQSFIVQAPAGSGKTELLTQRYLALLAQACAAPEEIVAITFTRKAALEMQERVLRALQKARDPQEPTALHQHRSYQLARAALRQDSEQGWRLLENPQRLRILTIDALCAELSRRLPILSRQGALARIVENPTPFYEKAVRDWMIQEDTGLLLAHLNNDSQKLMQLCVELLKKREQWLPYIGLHFSTSSQLRSTLEAGLAEMAKEILAATQLHFNPESLRKLQVLLSFAGENLLAAKKDHSLTLWAKRTQPLSAHPQELESWRALAQSLLTAEGQWRKQINNNLGFPPKCAEKQLFLELLSQLSQNEILAEHLRQIVHCPPIHYQEDQWRMVSSLAEKLPSLCAHLQVIFQQHGVMDFVELNLMAHRALGDQQEPTDLALALDYRIRHFLVDEFQDTSVAQLALLEKLVQGWEPGDGRSIFLVGDPQQSIYRFRNAEVGLFIRTVKQGIQQLPLVSLTLTRNFRSGQKLIDWFNSVFSEIFPAEADFAQGAVPYSPALSTQEQIVSPALQFQPFYDEMDESNYIVEQIQRIRSAQPDSSIAILVRSRTHLVSLIAALQNQSIKFQAIDIESLVERPEIQDLAALAGALHHRGDRISWLSVLRAPYCGLMLKDLHLIAGAAEFRTIYEVILNFEDLSELSDDAKLRLNRIRPVLKNAMDHRGRLALAEWIHTTWQELGGEAALDTQQEWLNSLTFFKLLRENQTYKKLENLYAAPDPHADARLQIMTIHKAKGLEFDHVFLPQLHRQPAQEKHSLLLWTQLAHAQGGSHLLLAPIKAASADFDSLYDFLRRSEQIKLHHEAKRLLYVAATRAKQTLHLTAVIEEDTDLKKRPHPGSFLEMLWSFFQDEINGMAPKPQKETTEKSLSKNNYQRLTVDWRPLDAKKSESLSSERDLFTKRNISEIPIFGGKKEICTGIVIHEALADLADQFPNIAATRSEEYYRRRLWQLGIAADDLESALTQVRQARHNILQDPRGLWILSSEHHDCKNEYSCSAVVNHQIVHVIIDRTFIDKDGIRWIIDYKTGDPKDLDRYDEQLSLYAKILSLKDTHPIRTALYFPLLSLFLEPAQSLLDR